MLGSAASINAAGLLLPLTVAADAGMALVPAMLPRLLLQSSVLLVQSGSMPDAVAAAAEGVAMCCSDDVKVMLQRTTAVQAPRPAHACLAAPADSKMVQRALFNTIKISSVFTTVLQLLAVNSYLRCPLPPDCCSSRL
jgi:hypothetical protein